MHTSGKLPNLFSTNLRKDQVLEILFKIIISLAAIFVLAWIWTHQIDPTETFKRFFRERAEKTVDWIVTRDENKIYQDGEEVGKVIGEIKEVEGKFMFQEFHNSFALELSKTFDYRRHIYRIIQVEVIAQSAVTEHGIVRGFMKNILCERLEK